MVRPKPRRKSPASEMTRKLIPHTGRPTRKSRFQQNQSRQGAREMPKDSRSPVLVSFAPQ